MNRPGRALLHGFGQALWSLLLTYVILAVISLLFGQYIGIQEALLVCLAIALLVTATFALIFLVDAARILLLWKSCQKKRQ